MNDPSPRPPVPSLLVHLQDCALASLAMGFVYLAGGVEALVILVFGFSLGLVILLLLREAYWYFDPDDDDYFYW